PFAGISAPAPTTGISSHPIRSCLCSATLAGHGFLYPEIHEIWLVALQPCISSRSQRTIEHPLASEDPPMTTRSKLLAAALALALVNQARAQTSLNDYTL